MSEGNVFKVGDLVEFVDESGRGFCDSVKGQHYVVTEDKNPHPYYVRLNDSDTCNVSRLKLVEPFLQEFKIGDTVRVKTDIKEGDHAVAEQHGLSMSNSFVKYRMGCYEGTEYTITDFDSDGYSLEGDDENWGWMPQWLELVEDEPALSLNEARVALEESKQEIARLKAIIEKASLQLAEI